MIKYAVLFLAIFMINSSFAQIYKWTDSSGNVHFADKPRPGAEQVELPEAQTSFSLPPHEIPAEQPQAAAEEINYTITVVEPEHQVTIRNNQGYLSILLDISPELSTNDKLQILFDGAPLGEPQSTTVFALRDVNRGSHTIAAQIINSEGKVLKTSEAITVFMHRPRAGMVPSTKPRGR